MTADLSTAAARRIALAAQGFADRPPTGAPTMAHFKRVVGRTKLLQMDSVNVLERAHYLPAFSRLGAYDTGLLDRAAWPASVRSPRLLAEYWAHEAALIPVDDWPLFGWRMTELADGRWRSHREALRGNRPLADDIIDVVTERGAAAPKQLEQARGIERPGAAAGSWWQRGEVKHVCEALFAAGVLASVRDARFVRHYDLAERVVGEAATGAQIGQIDAVRELVRRAAAAHGIATVADLADYYRLRTGQVRAVLPDLVDDGTVAQVRVEGWSDPGYLHRGARVRRNVSRSAILSPFDPLIFYRPRTERLFDFHYRIEIYVPEHQRVHGYYVLPYLLDEQLVARVDLKADRKAGVLQVLSAHHEPGVDVGRVAEALAGDLRALAGWRGLGDVVVSPRGDLARALRTWH
ncbi:MAG: crosslink repair DNA glycosylase YcaQ family protein [Gordonia sp. (in: high G+C Gram-positive bacteria)]|uniref:winged helix-turn-helix domain-containing protein n=1 Tax=Gordonia sp. (in: high G+C Gram-positive bacteria) TaxID=84139 RepID=UPI003BB5AFB9